jgi:hypothetical protein
MNINHYSPNWMRADHPIVQRYLRQPLLVRFNLLILTVVIGLFLLFGGLSLPMLYFLFSLVVLLQVALATADKVYSERAGSTWDLVRTAPFTPTEILLSLWIASIRQLNRTWMMLLYRLLQGMLVIGMLVFGLWYAEIPGQSWLLLLICGTFVIVAQPFAEMYYSGMIGLLCASLTRDRLNAHSFAVGAVLVYWLSWIALVLFIMMSNLNQLVFAHILAALMIPLLLPLILGYTAFQFARAQMIG